MVGVGYNSFVRVCYSVVRYLGSPRPGKEQREIASFTSFPGSNPLAAVF